MNSVVYTLPMLQFVFALLAILFGIGLSRVVNPTLRYCTLVVAPVAGVSAAMYIYDTFIYVPTNDAPMSLVATVFLSGYIIVIAAVSMFIAIASKSRGQNT